MTGNVIPFPPAALRGVTDDDPSGPGGSSLHSAAILGCARFVRTLRGVVADRSRGRALAA